MNVLHLEIREKLGIFRLTYHPHRFSADCTRSCSKPSKDSARLRVCIEKKIFWFWVSFFCE